MAAPESCLPMYCDWKYDALWSDARCLHWTRESGKHEELPLNQVEFAWCLRGVCENVDISVCQPSSSPLFSCLFFACPPRTRQRVRPSFPATPANLLLTKQHRDRCDRVDMPELLLQKTRLGLWQCTRRRLHHPAMLRRVPQNARSAVAQAV